MATLLKKILLIEDSRTDSFLIQRVIREYPPLSSHTLIIREDMKSAQAYLDENRDGISLILLDLGLPDTVDGKDSYEQLALSNVTDIPVIALTSIDNRNMATTLAELGLEDYLCKTDVMLAPLLLAQSIDFILSRHVNKIESIRHMMGTVDFRSEESSFPNA